MNRPIPPGQGADPPGPWAPNPRNAPQGPLPPDPYGPQTGPYGQPPMGYGQPTGPQAPPPTGWYGPGQEPWAPTSAPLEGPYPRAVGPSSARPTRRRRWPWVLLTVVLAVVVGAGTWANVGGIRTRLEHLVDRVDLALHPPVDRATVPTIEVTPPPGEVDDEDIAVAVPDPSEEVEIVIDPDASTPTPAPVTPRPDLPSAAPTAERTQAATPAPTRTPRPERKPVRFRLKVANPRTRFISQVDNTMCASAGIQMVLGMHDQVAMTDAVQKRIHGRLDEWETRQDAKAGGWGPSAMAEALAAYGVKGYEVRAYENRNQSLREAAAAMARTGAPAILIAWRGAHTWVMTGFRADADPTVFRDARITGINVFDPWYPTVSTIWGPSDPPGTLQDLAEIKRNFLQWERPEGAYPRRDGKYIVVVPTIPLKEQRGDER